MNVLNKLPKTEEGGVLTIHGVIDMLPSEDKIEMLAKDWCDMNSESWNAQYSSYIAAMNAIVDEIKRLPCGVVVEDHQKISVIMKLTDHCFLCYFDAAGVFCTGEIFTSLNGGFEDNNGVVMKNISDFEERYTRIYGSVWAFLTEKEMNKFNN